MLFDNFELRISFQKLLIGLTLSIIPLSVAGLYVTTQSDRSVQQTVGTHFRAIAQAKGDQVSQFLNERVVACTELTAAQTVRDAITASNSANRGLSEGAIQEKVRKIVSVWSSPAADAVRGVLASKASQFLRRQRELDARFLRIIVQA
jgi:hypothetical protein